MEGERKIIHISWERFAWRHSDSSNTPSVGYITKIQLMKLIPANHRYARMWWSAGRISTIAMSRLIFSEPPTLVSPSIAPATNSIIDPNIASTTLLFLIEFNFEISIRESTWTHWILLLLLVWLFSKLELSCIAFDSITDVCQAWMKRWMRLQSRIKQKAQNKAPSFVLLSIWTARTRWTKEITSVLKTIKEQKKNEEKNNCMTGWQWRRWIAKVDNPVTNGHTNFWMIHSNDDRTTNRKTMKHITLHVRRSRRSSRQKLCTPPLFLNLNSFIFAVPSVRVPRWQWQ